ncbi:MAG: DUF1801 domain-containing protein [Cyclobacteriaceae bacterium]|nr:DUF1801 domain-containing protein [Cyclobacteriaceae bacterium]
MKINEEIEKYLASQPEPKHSELEKLHGLILKTSPKCRLWFLDGKNDQGKVVSNPSIGYGLLDLKYANGKTKRFYQVGISANTSGISVYVIGIEDKTYLAKTYAKKLGKASVTGYCIKFKTLNDINIDVLEEVIRFGFENGKLETEA